MALDEIAEPTLFSTQGGVGKKTEIS